MKNRIFISCLIMLLTLTKQHCSAHGETVLIKPDSKIVIVKSDTSVKVEMRNDTIIVFAGCVDTNVVKAQDMNKDKKPENYNISYWAYSVIFFLIIALILGGFNYL